MDDVAGQPTPLRRLWWFPDVPALSSLRHGIGQGTYRGYPLDDLPPVGQQVDPELTWLDGYPAVPEWRIDTTDATPSRPLTPRDLDAVCAGATAPPAISTLAARPELQGRIRSFTGCYLDLGDFAVPTTAGVLLHLLSDQQWVRHWLAVVGGPFAGMVVSTSQPVGFELPDDWEEPAPPAFVAFDDPAADISVSADTVEEFLYRLWVENEIAFRTAAGEALDQRCADYLARLRAP